MKKITLLLIYFLLFTFASLDSENIELNLDRFEDEIIEINWSARAPVERVFAKGSAVAPLFMAKFIVVAFPATAGASSPAADPI